MDHRRSQIENSEQGQQNTMDVQVSPFIVQKKLSTVKPQLYHHVTEAILELQTTEEKEKLRPYAFKDIEKCFEHEFQCKAMQFVCSDNTEKYFRKNACCDIVVLDDSAIRRFEGCASLAQAIDAHDEGVLPSREEDEKNLDNRNFFGRLVHPYNDQYPGRVEQVHNRRDRKLLAKDRCVLTVKYYFGIIGEGRTKKVMTYTREELLPSLIV